MAEKTALPAVGVPAEDVLAEIRALRGLDLPTHGGRLFAYVYDSGVAELDELAAAAYALSAPVNGLDPTAFPSLLAMENALVAAAAGLLGGGPDGVATVVGTVNSGGTESLILAVKAARDAHPEIEAPELVIPASAHASFAKAAKYLRVKPRVVPIDPKTLRPSVDEIAAAITPQTILVVASAPSYPYGVIDPVAEIAAVAAAAGVRCHVDACIGGWVLPYLRRLGERVPDFDFAVPGVTSISVDLHKFAYCSKGVSVLLHRDAALRATQYFAYADWPGYTIINPTIASTRSGGPIAAAYATLRHLGDEGYLRLVVAARDSVRALAAEISSVAGLRLLTGGSAEPETIVVAFATEDESLDLFVLADELTARGWYTQPQLRFADLPRSIHLTVTAAAAAQVAEFGPALLASVEAARAAGPVDLPEDVLGLVATLTPEQLTPEFVGVLAAGLGLGDGDGGLALPSRMAVVNTILDAAPAALREALLIAFLGMLQRP